MSNALVNYNGPADGSDVQGLAQHLVKSGFFPNDRDLSKAVTKIMLGRGLGLDPMTAMGNLIVVQGRLSMSAHLMARLIKASGRYRYTVDEWTDKICSVTLYEKIEDTPGGKWSWFQHKPVVCKIDEFKHLSKNQTWQQYPRNMLFARTISNVARMLCPDVFGGSVYLPDEIPGGAEVDGETLEVRKVNDTVEGEMQVESDDPLALRLKGLGLTVGWACEVLRVKSIDWESLSAPRRKSLSEALEAYEEVHSKGDGK